MSSEQMQDRLVYDICDIQNLLGLKRSSAYNFIKKVYQDKEPFRVIRIGSLYRIPKADFDRWIREIKGSGDALPAK